MKTEARDTTVRKTEKPRENRYFSDGIQRHFLKNIHDWTTAQDGTRWKKGIDEAAEM